MSNRAEPARRPTVAQWGWNPRPRATSHCGKSSCCATGYTSRIVVAHFFCALFWRQLGVLIAPWGGKALSPAHPYWGVPHEGQSLTVALLWASGNRLSGLLKEPFTHTGRQLRPEGDELLKIGIDCARFCAACVVFCVALCGDRRFSRGLLQLFESLPGYLWVTQEEGYPDRRLSHNPLDSQGGCAGIGQSVRAGTCRCCVAVCAVSRFYVPDSVPLSVACSNHKKSVPVMSGRRAIS